MVFRTSVLSALTAVLVLAGATKSELHGHRKPMSAVSGWSQRRPPSQPTGLWEAVGLTDRTKRLVTPAPPQRLGSLGQDRAAEGRGPRPPDSRRRRSCLTCRPEQPPEPAGAGRWMSADVPVSVHDLVHHTYGWPSHGGALAAPGPSTPLVDPTQRPGQLTETPGLSSVTQAHWNLTASSREKVKEPVSRSGRLWPLTDGTTDPRGVTWDREGSQPEAYPQYTRGSKIRQMSRRRPRKVWRLHWPTRKVVPRRGVSGADRGRRGPRPPGWGWLPRVGWRPLSIGARLVSATRAAQAVRRRTGALSRPAAARSARPLTAVMASRARAPRRLPLGGRPWYGARADGAAAPPARLHPALDVASLLGKLTAAADGHQSAARRARSELSSTGLHRGKQRVLHKVGTGYNLPGDTTDGYPSASTAAMKEQCLCEDFSRPGTALGVLSLAALLVYALTSTSSNYQAVANATATGRARADGAHYNELASFLLDQTPNNETRRTNILKISSNLTEVFESLIAPPVNWKMHPAENHRVRRHLAPSVSPVSTSGARRSTPSHLRPQRRRCAGKQTCLSSPLQSPESKERTSLNSTGQLTLPLMSRHRTTHQGSVSVLSKRSRRREAAEAKNNPGGWRVARRAPRRRGAPQSRGRPVQRHRRVDGQTPLARHSPGHKSWKARFKAIMAKLRRSIRGSRRPKGYNHHECDCPERTGLKELLGFLPIAVVLGYTTTVSASAAAGGTTSGGGSTTSVTVSGGNTVTSTNTNTPSLTNTDNDVITVSAQANPLNTLTNTASNQDNDIITNTARHLGAAADFSTPPTLWSLLVSPRVAHKRTSGKVRLPSRTASSPLPEIQEALQERVATTGELISGRPVPRSLPAVPGRAVSGTTRRPPDREADHGWRRPDLGHPSRPQRDQRPMYRQLPVSGGEDSSQSGVGAQLAPRAVLPAPPV